MSFAELIAQQHKKRRTRTFVHLQLCEIQCGGCFYSFIVLIHFIILLDT